MSGLLRVLILFLFSSSWLLAQHKHMEEETQIIPNPLKANSYFHIKVPDGEALKRVEVIDSTGTRINKTDITFTKMGLFMPRIKPGNYALRIEMAEDTVLKKIAIY